MKMRSGTARGIHDERNGCPRKTRNASRQAKSKDAHRYRLRLRNLHAEGLRRGEDRVWGLRRFARQIEVTQTQSLRCCESGSARPRRRLESEVQNLPEQRARSADIVRSVQFETQARTNSRPLTARRNGAFLRADNTPEGCWPGPRRRSDSPATS